MFGKLLVTLKDDAHRADARPRLPPPEQISHAYRRPLMTYFCVTPATTPRPRT